MSEFALTVVAIVLGLGAVAVWAGLLSLARDSLLLGLTRAQAFALLAAGIVLMVAACVTILSAEGV